MLRKKRILCSMLAVMTLLCNMPVPVQAAEGVLQTEVLAVREEDGQVTAVYDTKEGEAPDQILYAVSKDGQFVWDSIVETSGKSGKQYCVLDIPEETLERDQYDVVVWGQSEGEDGEKQTSETYAFKVNLGTSADNLVIPVVQSSKTMVVNMPFAYITKDTSMEEAICYLKEGDTVQVYTDTEENAVVYVTKDGISGYMYSRSLTNKVFDLHGAGSDEIVEVAKSQLGNVGGAPYGSWYGFNGRVEWCACFVSWCASQCGYIEAGVIPKFAHCEFQGKPWFIANGQWMDRNCEPEPGYIIFFDWGGDGTADHVGIVEKCENGIVYTIEGNSSDACKQRSYPVGSSKINGYGVPAY